MENIEKHLEEVNTLCHQTSYIDFLINKVEQFKSFEHHNLSSDTLSSIFKLIGQETFDLILQTCYNSFKDELNKINTNILNELSKYEIIKKDL